jgi:L-fucose dehydrogenase
MGSTNGMLYTGLENKVVLVTGGARGIGAEIVRQFASIGAFPIFIDINKENGIGLEESLKIEGHECKYIQADLQDESQCRQAVLEAASLGRKVSGAQGENQRIDVLVNCAGANDNLSTGASAEQIQKSFALNLVPYILMSALCWNYLKAAPADTIDGLTLRGNIINIGSKTGDVGQKGSWTYSAAKGGINALTKSAARDGAEYGIRVNSVNPSEVYGEHYREWAERAYQTQADEVIRNIAKKIPLGGRMTTEREIATVVLFLASNKLSSHTTAQIIRPNGGSPEYL